MSAPTLGTICLLLGIVLIAWIVVRVRDPRGDDKMDTWSQSTFENDFGPDFGPARNAQGKPREDRVSHLSTRPGTIQ